MKKNNKKKGFTLIELIAVIAILGILAAVIVPRVGNFTDSAKKSRDKANAATILNALEIFNAQSDDDIIIETTTTAVKDLTMPTNGNATAWAEFTNTRNKLESTSSVLSAQVKTLTSLANATN